MVHLLVPNAESQDTGPLIAHTTTLDAKYVADFSGEPCCVFHAPGSTTDRTAKGTRRMKEYSKMPGENPENSFKLMKQEKEFQRIARTFATAGQRSQKYPSP